MNFVIVCLRPSQNLKLGSRGSPRMEQCWPNLVSEMRKVNSNQKSPGSLLDIAPEIVNEWNGYLEIFSFPQAVENSRQCFASPNRYFTENSH